MRSAGLTRWARISFFLLLSFRPAVPGPLWSAEALQEIVVKEGETIWSIANHYLKDPKRWPEILKHNKQLTNDPTVALPGMRLRVPALLIKEKLRSAELVLLENDVRYRRRDAGDWEKARPHMELYHEDGLRTLEESNAQVRFPTGEIIKLSENSLVTIRPEKGRDAVQLLSGDVRASQARVITAGGATINPLGPGADYRTRVKLDKSELVLVFRGQVDVTAQGKTVRIPQGYGSEIKPMLPPTEPIPLPKVPLLRDKSLPELKSADVSVKASEDKEGLVLSVDVPALKEVDLPPEKSGASKARSVSHQSVKSFHLQIDDQDTFQEPVLDKHFAVPHSLNLQKLGLPDGSYWWRMSVVDSLGLESAYSIPRSFQVDRRPPPLSLLSPKEGETFRADDDFIRVTGETEPNAFVSIGDKSTKADAQGRFTATVFIPGGESRIAVTARDPSGNETTLQRSVSRDAPKTESRAAQAKPGAVPSDEGRSARSGFLANFGIGIVTIGTIAGIILLILG
ncbi:MAG: LysM peptidoglycan-binding domain-containing protein [Elusimicrobia bacterium]|nr:LysM peptidoglycan-binding domain-containing protein [Elusimicrobiota bacterium]